MAAELARHEWAAGYRRLENERENEARYRALLAQVAGISDELRRRIGSVFTISELASEYRRAERLGSPGARRAAAGGALPRRGQPRDRRCVPLLCAWRARLRALSTASTPTPPARRERRPPKRVRRRRALIGAIVLVVVFGVGLALGQALDDNPPSGDTQTFVRTLKPLELPPARETVTVTVRR